MLFLLLAPSSIQEHVSFAVLWTCNLLKPFECFDLRRPDLLTHALGKELPKEPFPSQGSLCAEYFIVFLIFLHPALHDSISSQQWLHLRDSKANLVLLP